MSVVNMGEVLYILTKSVGEEIALKHIRTMQHAIAMINVDAEQASQAAILKHHCKLGYADSYAAVLALRHKARLVSADAAFQKLGRRIRWMKLPLFRPVESLHGCIQNRMV